MPSAERESESGSTPTVTRGRLVVRSAREAVNATERLLCGPCAVTRPAVAEGLALSGRRAATLLVPVTAGPTGSHTASANVPWVHHRNGAGTSQGFAFELVGVEAQDVVDHGLVAHDLARRIGLPGLCTFEPSGVERLARVRLPDDAMLRELDDAPSDRGDDVAAEAVHAFARVSKLTGRAIAPVTTEGPDAAHAIVASAAARPLARRLARALEDGGTPCKVVCVHLVRPFPTAAFNAALSGLTATALIPAEGLLDSALPLVSTVLPADDVSPGAARAAFGLPPADDDETAPAASTETVGWTARPAGPWAERFLLDAAARLETDAEITLDQESPTLVVGPNASPGLPAGVALCAHPSYVEDGGLLDALADGATVLIASAAAFPDTWWEDLDPQTRATILDRELRLKWIDLGAAGLELTDTLAVREALLDAFHQKGGQPLEPQALQSLRVTREPDFSAEAESLPTMPEPAADSDDKVWRDASRHFHLTGEGAHSAAEPTSAEPLHPLVLAAMDAGARQGARYPLFLGAGTVPFETRVTEVLEQFETEKQPATMLGHHLPRLSNAVGRVASKISGPSGTDELLGTALEEFRRGFELSDAAAETLRLEGDRLRERLGAVAEGSTIVGLDPATLPCLHAAAVRRVRGDRRETLLEEVDSLVRQLEELLAIDDGHDSSEQSAEALESSFGADAADLFDPKKLADTLPRRRGSVRLSPERRRRVEQAFETLRGAKEIDADVDVVVIRPDGASEEIPGARIVPHPRGLGLAIGLFDGMADRYTGLFRALRVARLEVDDAYDPQLHDVPLARFDWQSLTEDELLTMPRVVVLESAERLRGAGLGAFAELLRSGRPVHVLVEQSTSELRAAETWQGLGGFHPGLGYVAVAHREAFVVESSLVCPDRLAQDLESMAASLRPGAALVAVPAWNATVPAWVQLLAAEQARSVPCFTYDPEGGQHWAERFNLDGNPQPDRPWPLHTVRYVDDSGAEQTLEQAFTFAHAVALDPAYREHFRILPDEAWSAEQIELGEYLAAPVAAVDRKIPFIWVVGDGDRLARALVTRELAHASRDRLRAWRILQELAGTDNEYARRAAAAARESLGAEHAAEVERVRNEAAGQAMNRLARVLMDFDGEPLPAGQAPPSAPAPTEAAGTTEAPAAEEPAPPPVFDEAYIDSALCTSCHDCININNRMFNYDANKQAFIADTAKGTYEQLVRAAEKCPARCIHPGAPAPDDTSVTDGVIARAAKFK